jgi:hypothetical protein
METNQDLIFAFLGDTQSDVRPNRAEVEKEFYRSLAGRFG